MYSKQKKMLIRVIITSIIFFPLLVTEHLGVLESLPVIAVAIIFLIPYCIIGYDIILKAVRNIKNGQVFDENFLMMIATLAAFGIKEFSESVAVMLFYQVGELFQGYAVGKSRQSIASMMDMAPEYANLETEDGISQEDPDDIEIGSVIVIKPGERTPLDGVVIEGTSLLDTSALTGESVPRTVGVGDDIISGCINTSGTLRVRTTKEYDDCTVAKILELVENASEKKAATENFITRFARYYTPAVTIGALLLAVLGPVVTGGGFESVSDWILRACTFLVVSCPCALVISIPMGFFGGIGAASKQGILVKGSNYLELMADTGTVLFDKTGTLTKGEFKVSDILPEAGISEKELLRLAAHAECYSNHPIALSVQDAYIKSGEKVDTTIVLDASEEAGHGTKVLVEGNVILAGNEKLMKAHNIEYVPYSGAGTVVYLAQNNKYIGAVVISDGIKDGVSEALKTMKKLGVTRTVMLTGDRKAAAEAVAKVVGVDEYYAELLPGDKVSRIESILTDKKGKKCVAFVGDGINDAPVLTRADVGIAMGSLGSDAAIEAADIVLMDDDVKKIASVVRISRETMAIVRENIVLALSIKLIVLILGAIGIANMWAAVFADVGVSVLAILNSMRTLNSK